MLWLMYSNAFYFVRIRLDFSIRKFFFFGQFLWLLLTWLCLKTLALSTYIIFLLSHLCYVTSLPHVTYLKLLELIRSSGNLLIATWLNVIQMELLKGVSCLLFVVVCLEITMSLLLGVLQNAMFVELIGAIFMEIMGATLAIEIAFEKMWHKLWLECDSCLIVVIFQNF